MKKKIMLGTSDAWSMSHSSHRPSEPVYYIEDCRILELRQRLERWITLYEFINLQHQYLSLSVRGGTRGTSTHSAQLSYFLLHWFYLYCFEIQSNICSKLFCNYPGTIDVCINRRYYQIIIQPRLTIWIDPAILD